MTQSHLIVKEEGIKIYKDDPSSAILCEDQDKAMNIVWKIQTGGYVDPREFKPAIGSIYPVPGIEFKEIPCCADDSCPFDANCEYCRKPIKLARLIEHTAEKESATGFTGKVVGDMVWDKEKNDFKIVKSESPEIDKEEELWDEVGVIIYRSQSFKFYEHVIKELKEKFTIQRKP